jgi:hypothetical protein
VVHDLVDGKALLDVGLQHSCRATEKVKGLITSFCHLGCVSYRIKHPLAGLRAIGMLCAITSAHQGRNRM